MKNNILAISKTNSDCAQYTGTVTVTSYIGDRLIQKETHHNAGLKMLFEFIGSCLQGNWTEARDKRPCKLVMLRTTDAEESFLTSDESKDAPEGAPGNAWSTPLNLDALDSQGEHYWSSKYAVCGPTMYDTAAISTTTGTSSSTTYHFRVPFLSLVGGSKIKKLMLLPPMATNYQEEACAYYVLDTEIKVPEASANFTVIIDWTLEFTNSAAQSTTV